MGLPKASDQLRESAPIRGSVAEEVGFEPTVRFHARRFSRPVHSTTLPLLRCGLRNDDGAILKGLPRHGLASLWHALFSYPDLEGTLPPKSFVQAETIRMPMRPEEQKMTPHSRAAALISLSAFILTACEDGQGFNFGTKTDEAEGEVVEAATPGTPQSVLKDVERPDIFNVTEAALWDGPPLAGRRLGGTSRHHDTRAGDADQHENRKNDPGRTVPPRTWKTPVPAFRCHPKPPPPWACWPGNRPS